MSKNEIVVKKYTAFDRNKSQEPKSYTPKHNETRAKSQLRQIKSQLGKGAKKGKNLYYG